MRRALCPLCAAARFSESRAASTVATSSLEKAGLPYTSRAQWEHEERTLVQRGLSPFKTDARAARRPRALPAHLDPNQLLERLGRMIDKLQIMEAIAKLREADRQALRPAVFNMLINACMRTGREQQAFDVYRDMKAKGLTPTPHTYSALLGGLLKTRNLNPRLLARAKSVHHEWVELYRSSAEVAALAGGKGNIPTNAYLQLLGRVNDIPLMFEMFYAMPREGPQAPNLHTYTVMMQALSKEPSEEDVASAIGVWNMLCDDENVPVVDAHAFSGLSEALLAASEKHKMAVLQIARVCFGFLRSLDPAAKEALDELGIRMPRTEKRVGRWQLHYKAVSSIFHHLGQLDLSEIAIAWLRQILTTQHMAVSLDATHFEKLLWQFGQSGNAKAAEDALRLMLEQTAEQHRPTRSAYAYALQACLASDDIERALRIFGMHVLGSVEAHSLFLVNAEPPSHVEDLGQADIKCLAVLAALAYASADQQHALRIVQIAERTRWLPWTRDAPSREPKSEDPDAVEKSAALTVMTELGNVNASRHAQLMAARAAKAGRKDRAALLRQQADTLSKSDAGVQAHYLSAHRSADAPPDPDFVAGAASREQAAIREEHRNRFWEPKLARALLRCVHMAIELAEPADVAKWEDYRKPLSAYFANGGARGVSSSALVPYNESTGTLQRVKSSQRVPAEYALTRVEAQKPALVVEKPQIRNETAPARTKAPRISRKVQLAQKRLNMQGVRTRRRPRPDLIQDRRAATRKPLRLNDLRPAEEKQLSLDKTLSIVCVDRTVSVSDYSVSIMLSKETELSSPNKEKKELQRECNAT